MKPLALEVENEVLQVLVEGDDVDGPAVFLSHVHYQKIPLFMLHGSFLVYSEDPHTERFFAQLVGHQVGCLFRAGDAHVLMYYSGKVVGHHVRVPALPPAQDKNTFVELELPKLDTSTVFDKVLEQRLQRPTPKESPPSPPKNPSMTTDQVTQAVNKLVLSGLRLRGLSTKNPSLPSNERITIKEIYQMTRNATLFSLRKYNYSFNGLSGASITLDLIRDTVEKLLDVFVDPNI